MKCPVCNEVELTMSERQGVEIDYCPRCRGVWLDRGELDKIIERAAAEAPALTPEAPRAAQPPQQAPYPPQQHYGDPYSDRGRDYGHHRPHKRRKSFLEELFD